MFGVKFGASQPLVGQRPAPVVTQPVRQVAAAPAKQSVLTQPQVAQPMHPELVKAVTGLVQPLAQPGPIMGKRVMPQIGRGPGPSLVNPLRPILDMLATKRF